MKKTPISVDVINGIRRQRSTPTETGAATTIQSIADTFNVSVSTVHKYTKDISQMIKEKQDWEIISRHVQEGIDSLEKLSNQLRKRELNQIPDQVKDILKDNMPWDIKIEKKPKNKNKPKKKITPATEINVDGLPEHIADLVEERFLSGKLNDVEGDYEYPEEDIKEEIDNVKTSGYWEDDDGMIHMPVKRTDGEIVNEDTIKIPLQVIDNIFMDYSKSAGQGRLSSWQIVLKYNLQRYHENPNRIMRVLRTRMNLNQSCYLWSYHTIYKMKTQLGEDGYNELVQKRKEEALEGRYKPDFVQEDLKTENKFLKKKIKQLHGKMSNIEYWGNIVRDLGVEKVKFRNVPPKNTDQMVVMMGDWHLDGHYDAVRLRVERMVTKIKRSGKGHVTLFGMGDWFESIASTGMHPDSELDIDPRFLDPRDKVQAVVGLMISMLESLNDDGIRVDFKMLNGNHDRVSKNNDEDRYRMGGFYVSEILRYAVQSMNVKIENLANRVQSVMVGETCYIVGHGESDIYKKKASESIELFARSRGMHARHYVIAMGHLHSVRTKSGKVIKVSKMGVDFNEVEEGGNYTQIIVNPMCDGAFYSNQKVMKASNPGFVELHESGYDDVPAPSVHIERV